MKKWYLLKNKILLPVVFIGIFGWFQAVEAQCGANCINPVPGENYPACSSYLSICTFMYDNYYSNTPVHAMVGNVPCTNVVQFCTNSGIFVEGVADPQ